MDVENGLPVSVSSDPNTLNPNPKSFSSGLLQRADRAERLICATGTAWGLLSHAPYWALVFWWLLRHFTYFGLTWLLLLFSPSGVAIGIFGVVFFGAHIWKAVSFYLRWNRRQERPYGAAGSKVASWKDCDVHLRKPHPSSKWGIITEPVTDCHVPDGKVRIIGMAPDSCAQQDLRIGDIIKRVDGTQVESCASFVAVINLAHDLATSTSGPVLRVSRAA